LIIFVFPYGPGCSGLGNKVTVMVKKKKKKKKTQKQTQTQTIKTKKINQKKNE
jgi:hypothetical protein